MDSVDQAHLNHDTTFTISMEGVKRQVTTKGDSVFEFEDATDTLFSRQRGDILRRFKGYYFINRPTGKDNWAVTRIARVKNGVAIGQVSMQDDIKNLREITGALSDSGMTFRPSRKQFRKFLNENGFHHEEGFLKVD
jgi:hypothetical protein